VGKKTTLAPTDYREIIRLLREQNAAQRQHIMDLQAEICRQRERADAVHHPDATVPPAEQCDIEWCEMPKNGNSPYCAAHRKRERLHGDPLLIKFRVTGGWNHQFARWRETGKKKYVPATSPARSRTPRLPAAAS
jgi:hypothetical protein